MLSQKVALGAAGNASADSYWYFQTQSTVNTSVSYSLTLDGNDNIYAAGYIWDNYYTDSGYVCKVDKDGILQNQQMLRTLYTDIFRDIVWDGSNHLYAVGNTNGTMSGYHSAMITKLDLNLNNVWCKYFDANNTLRFQAVDVDSLGQPVAGGWSAVHGNGGRENWLIKYNTTGGYIWQRSAGNQFNQEIVGISINSADEIHYCEWNDAGAVGSTDGAIGKFSANGSPIYYNYIGDTNGDRSYAIAHDSRDYFYVVGQNQNINSGYVEATIVQFDDNNSFVSQKMISYGNNAVSARSVVCDSQNNVYVLSHANNGANVEVLITKYDRNLTRQWNRAVNVNSPAYTYPTKIAVDSNDNIIVTGYTQAYGGANNLFILKLPSDGSILGSFVSGNYTVEIRDPLGVSYPTGTLQVGNVGYSLGTYFDSLYSPNGFGNTTVTVPTHLQSLP